MPVGDVETIGPNNTVIRQYSEQKRQSVANMVRVANYVMKLMDIEIKKETLENNSLNGVDKSSSSGNSTPVVQGEIKIE